MADSNALQVAVGVIKNAHGQLLIAQRQAHVHQGGLWEFSGGKIEAGETAEHALTRELKEELAIEVISTTPLITIKHQYPDLMVQLRVFSVDAFLGEPRGCEGQALQWVNSHDLKHYAFPAANQAIITAASLPCCYAILDDSEPSLLESHLQILLAQGIQLIQARLKNLSVEASRVFIEHAYARCQQYGALLLINSTVQCEVLADGVHLTSRDLMALTARPVGIKWLAASCHNLEELQHAEKIGVDFVVIAPVLATKTHPETLPLGWQVFSDLVSQCNVPVYALGGQTKTSLTIAQHAGGQGIAAIRAFLA